MDRFRSLIDAEELQDLVVQAGLSDEEPTGRATSSGAVRFTYTGMQDAVREPFVTGVGAARPAPIAPIPPRVGAIEGDVAAAVRALADWAREVSGADHVAVADGDGRAYTDATDAAAIAAGVVRLAGLWRTSPSGAVSVVQGGDAMHVAWSTSPIGRLLVVMTGDRPTSAVAEGIAERMRQLFTREDTP